MNRIIQSSSFKAFCKLSAQNSTEVFSALVTDILDLNLSVSCPMTRNIIFSRTKAELSIVKFRENKKK